ncbi:F-box only protein 39 [Sitodiplosis mosellana]|uniref:F-box only protein 39 n=1 Tax=Sitodiplosis mosellana TaxID=263140 RepID=UPI002443A057|nr:F-box only protein 39 [Sitodiplosis mosellana]
MERIQAVDWQSLDDLIMETIFEFLPIRDRFNASLVCRRWASCFDLPKVWRKVIIDGHWLTKTVCNDEDKVRCSDRVLDYERALNCLQRIGPHIRSVNICQLQDFVSLYQLFVLFESYFVKMQNSSPNIRQFAFNFPCDQPLEINPNGIKLFGIGGQVIGSFRKLLPKMQKLCQLELVDLVLERYEANKLLDQMSISLSHSLKLLSAVNLTNFHCPLQQIAMMSNLEILKLSPQNIDDSMLHLIVESNLKHLHIVQNENTPKTVMPCSAKAWTHFKQHASEHLQVHLEAISKYTNGCDLLIQPEAPVHSITCKNAKRGVINKIIGNYGSSVVIYSDQSSTLGDIDLIEIVSGCNHLSTLKILRPITTAALLVLAAMSENLQEISLNKSSAIVKHDDWIKEFCLNNGLDHASIQENCVSLNSVEHVISKQFSKPWRFLI